jgi:hypothetical protein
MAFPARTLGVSLAALAASCTLNVQNVSRTVTADSPLAVTTVETDVTGLVFLGGRVDVRGTDRSGAHAALTVAGLLTAGGSADAIDRGIELAWDDSASPRLVLDVGYHGPALESLSIDALTVDVPTSCGVDVAADDATVNVEGIAAPVRARTAGGSIVVRGSTAADLGADAGNVDVTAASAIVRTVSGGIALDLTGMVDVESTSGSVHGMLRDGGSITCASGGSIRVDLASLTSDLDLETYDGAIELRVPVDASLDLELTSSGPLHVAVGSVVLDGTGSLTARLGAGGPRVVAHAHSGSVRIVEL